MRKLRILIASSAILVLALAAQTVRAQDDPSFDVGLRPFGAYSGGNIDNVGIASGNLSVDFPLISYPQRGGKLGLAFSFHYQSGPATTTEHCNSDGTICSVTKKPFQHGTDVIESGVPAPTVAQELVAPFGSTYVNMSVTTGEGAVHQLAPITEGNAVGGDPPTSYGGFQGGWIAIDGSGNLLNSNFSNGNTIVTDPNGTQYTYAYTVPNLGGYAGPSLRIGPPVPPTLIEDTNGNEISFGECNGATGWTDTVGRCIPAPVSDTPSASDPYPCPTVSGQPAVGESSIWELPSLSGGTYPIKLCWVSVTEYYEYWNPEANENNGGNAEYNTFSYEIQSIVLPNGTAWTFQYNTSDGSGDLIEITFPTGGTLSYTWAPEYDGPGDTGMNFCSFYQCIGDVVATRTLNPNDGTASGTWTYNQGTGTVTDPAGNDTVHTFGSFTAQNESLYETSAVYYQGTGGTRTVLKTTNTTYSYDYPFNAGGGTAYPLGGWAVCVLPTQVTTTWASGQESKVTYAYDSESFYHSQYGPSGSGGTLNYSGGSTPWTGTLGKVLTEEAYDYGNGAPGSLLRTTTTAYEYQSNSSYATNNLLNLPASVQVTGSGPGSHTTFGYDEYSLANVGAVSTQHDSSPPAGSYRGNATSVHPWESGSTTSTTNCPISVSNGYLATYNVYNDTGTVDHSVDACGASASDANHKTAYAYSSTYIGAYPTTVTNPDGQSTTFAYDFNTGLRTSMTDPNNQTTGITYDQMLRVSQINYPDTGQTSFCYTDETTCAESAPAHDTAAVVTEALNSGQNEISMISVDGLGRKSQAMLVDPGGNDYIEIQYDVMGRKYKLWNPTRCSAVTTNCGEATWGVTTYSYDPLSRLQSVTDQDDSVASASYSGNCVTTTDEAAKSRKGCTDALGRLTTVWEDPNHLDYQTTYTYDALDDLTSAAQGGAHNRTFVYDSLKRLLQSTNPETGSVCYGTLSGSTCNENGYDANGNLVEKTDARSIEITYSYDYLNRILGRAYSNGDPSVSFAYDGSSCLGGQSPCYNVGRRTGMTDAAGSESFSYDPMGREWTEQRTITTNSLSKTTSYTYNLDGSLAMLTYPSGRTITYTPNAAGQPVSAVDVANSINYATGATYAPQGALASVTNGSNLVSTLYYNDRLQPCRVAATAGGTSPTSCTDSTDIGNILDLTYNFSLGTSDNGDVIGITNNRDGNRSQSFTYDNLNRLISGRTVGTYATDVNICWGEQFFYDNNTTTNVGEFGNLTSVGAVSSAYNGCSQDSLSVSAASNNQISATGMTYDASGNVLTDGTNTYAWNAESEMKTGEGVNYTYDGDGDRLEKSSGKIYWYGAGTESLDESDANGNITNEYVFFDGDRIAMNVVGSGTIYYYAEDLLGTSRGMVQAGQTSTCFDADFLPFGREKDVVTTCTQNDYKFEGKERDTETGNDNFGARYYSSNFGRWLSPDWSAIPEPVPYANLTNPQTLNLYAMVQDNPESFADPDGHGPKCDIGDSYGCSSDQLNSPTNNCSSVSADMCEQGEGPAYALPYCTVNGGQVPCGIALSLVQDGSGAICPGGDCSQIRQGPNGEWQIYVGHDDKPYDPPDCPTGKICVGTQGQAKWKDVSFAGMVLAPSIGGSELGPADLLVIGGTLSAYAYAKNKDAIDMALSQLGNVAKHIDFLNTNPEQDPRNGWRREIRASLEKARTWANRMSPGKRQDWINSMIDAAERAVPQD